ERGLVVFDLIEGSDLGDFRTRQDEAANLLDAKLRTEPGLTRRRDLRVPIHTVSFAPAAGRETLEADDQDYALADSERLTEVVRRMVWRDADNQAFDLALSTLEHIRTIRRKGGGKRPAGSQPDSRGAKLRSLEDPVATLDRMQSRAVIETIDGVQRIRGLAGSGKTI
ncbi:MAG: helicase, partial [Gemmatimonadota bacterium]|nr:helicase [Gemmatimonadota bacterium]